MVQKYKPLLLHSQLFKQQRSIHPGNQLCSTTLYEWECHGALRHWAPSGLNVMGIDQSTNNRVHITSFIAWHQTQLCGVTLQIRMYIITMHTEITTTTTTTNSWLNQPPLHKICIQTTSIYFKWWCIQAHSNKSPQYSAVVSRAKQEYNKRGLRVS